MACSRKLTDERSDAVFEIREAITERVAHISDRVAKWVRLAVKPPEARKVVFVFHKNECASLEANVGGAAGLDSGESVVRIMHQMQSCGYRIENIPESGEALMQTILARKAIAEFRWTTVDEIISKGGHLALLENETYRHWFNALPEKARADLVAAWGEPPGQTMNGVPPSMVLDGKLVITGLNFGHANVIMQPKHIVAQAEQQGASIEDPAHFRKLSYRIFCAQPGVYKAGVNLAVYASAWKTDDDLSDVYVFWNGYAYGGGAGDDSYGMQAHKELVENPRRVEVTFDKHISESEGLVTFGLARQLANAMNAQYFKIEDLKADTLLNIAKGEA